MSKQERDAVIVDLQARQEVIAELLDAYTVRVINRLDEVLAQNKVLRAKVGTMVSVQDHNTTVQRLTLARDALASDVAQLVAAMLDPAPGSKDHGVCHLCGAVQLHRGGIRSRTHHEGCPIPEMVERAVPKIPL